MPSKDNNKLSNLEELVSRGYCVGCGLCQYINNSADHRMTWTKYGYLEPIFDSSIDKLDHGAKVCPFSSGLIDGITKFDENSLAKQLFDTRTMNHDTYVGYYRNLYAGYSQDYQLIGSSGGMATWILTHLIRSEQIDKAICVRPTYKPFPLFEYQICSKDKEIIEASKSKYYPAHLGDVLKSISKQDGRYAIVALPCITKGLRLLQQQDPIINKRIVFIIGLFCGGLKSVFFTEYLSAQLKVNKDSIINPEYRVKIQSSASHEYIYRCQDLSSNLATKELQIKKLGDLWGPGFFKPNCCDYCDDVTAELADISLGDAWIKPYIRDWKGNNIVITRSAKSQEIIEEGIRSGELSLKFISSDQVYMSQQSNFENRRKGLAYRLYWNRNNPLPQKRVEPRPPANIFESNIYKHKIRIRRASHFAWVIQRNYSGTFIFKFIMAYDIIALKFWYFFHRLYKKYIRNKAQ